MILVLMAILGLMIMPAICILSFELARVFLAKQQLQNASDAAVLTATAQLASSNNTSPATAHTDAIAAAVKIFQTNYMLGLQLSNSNLVTSASSLGASPGEANLFFQFIDPVTKQVVPISSPNGKIINLQACAGAYTTFGKFYGIPQFQVTSISKGAVPIIDIEICFDVSGSMDDQTPVTFVTRKYDSTLHKTLYNISKTANGPNAEGTIYNIIQPPLIGTSLNANFPMCFEETNAYPWPSWYGNKLEFTYELGNSNLRSMNGWQPGIGEQGSPPGNAPGPNSQLDPSKNDEFTDLVVNLDGNNHFTSAIANGYSFPTLGTLVEAARGNLETQTAYTSSLASVSLPGTVQPRAGYQSAYWSAVNNLLQPIADSQAANKVFADILNTDTDCHFAFVAFDQTVNNTDTFSGDIDCNNSYGRLNQSYPVTFIPLNPALAQTNYNSVVTAIGNTKPLGGTDISNPINLAISDLQKNGRTGSVKAIILFTDGEPTDPQGPNGFDPTYAYAKAQARKAAVAASAAGIPVYTIGLAQTPAIEPSEIDILNDTNSDPTTGGIAAISGHGATFNLVTDSSQLQLTFEKIARRLVEIVANSAGDY
jgi:von Willebrand factor type A domain/Putative Flp pilus-assembly TadE/G-like